MMWLERGGNHLHIATYKQTTILAAFRMFIKTRAHCRDIRCHVETNESIIFAFFFVSLTFSSYFRFFLDAFR